MNKAAEYLTKQAVGEPYFGDKYPVWVEQIPHQNPAMAGELNKRTSLELYNKLLALQYKKLLKTGPPLKDEFDVGPLEEASRRADEHPKWKKHLTETQNRVG